jgi:glycosyltransferase involved in cell wall biosynthesis
LEYLWFQLQELKMPVEASIVIPTYNRVDRLRACLHALEKQTLRNAFFEVIVVDDGSTDDTLPFLRKFAERCGFDLRILNQNRQGPAAARNSGIRAAAGGLIAFTDDDCVPAASWIENLIKALPGEGNFGGIGGKIIRMRDSLISRYIDDSGAMNHGTQNGEVRYLVTANALYKKACLNEVGGFDSRISWPGGEDPDLSFRIRGRGYCLTTTQTAVIRHAHRDSLAGIYRMFWNHGRGRSALVQLGRIQKKSMSRLLASQYINSPIKYLKTKNLTVHERAIFCVLRWIQYTAIYIGYSRCRKISGDSV